MKKVCVITGGGSGMGLATAKMLGLEYFILIVGRSVKKLEQALEELRIEGIEAESFACDIAKRSSVDELALYARSMGVVGAVIHAAGMSPNMGDAKTIMEANALGTIHMNEAFLQVMEKGSCLIDVSSMSGYMVPSLVMPTKKYAFSHKDKELFIKMMMGRVKLFPKKLQSSVAYGISKNFVTWYAQSCAVKFGEKGIRVLSVSPGSFETPMGELEKDRVVEYTNRSALKRMGRVEEIAHLFAFCVSAKASYLTGVDILCDGGVVASHSKT